MSNYNVEGGAIVQGKKTRRSKTKKEKKERKGKKNNGEGQ
jgi:hypothetical protein